VALFARERQRRHGWEEEEGRFVEMATVNGGFKKKEIKLVAKKIKIKHETFVKL